MNKQESKELDGIEKSEIFDKKSMISMHSIVSGTKQKSRTFSRQDSKQSMLSKASRYTKASKISRISAIKSNTKSSNRKKKKMYKEGGKSFDIEFEEVDKKPIKKFFPNFKELKDIIIKTLDNLILHDV